MLIPMTIMQNKRVGPRLGQPIEHRWPRDLSPLQAHFALLACGGSKYVKDSLPIHTHHCETLDPLKTS